MELESATKSTGITTPEIIGEPKAKDLYDRIQVPLGTANVLTEQGHLENMQRNSGKAKEHYWQAKQRYEELEDHLGQANVSLGLGRVEAMLGNTEQAMNWYSEAKNIYCKIKNRFGQANVLLGLGHLEGIQHHFEQSQRDYSDAKKLYHTLGDHIGEAHALCGIGWSASLLGKTDEADKAYRDAGALYVRMQDYQGAQVTSGLIEKIKETKEKIGKIDSSESKSITNQPNKKSPIVQADKTGLLGMIQGLLNEFRVLKKSIITTCNKCLEYICQYLLYNIEWLFSGVMIPIIGGILLIRRNNKKSSTQNDTA